MKPAKDILVAQYTVQGLTTLQLAGVYSVNKTTISNWLKTYNISIRNAQAQYDYNRTLKLSAPQRDFIFGTMLGDGHIELLKSGRLARFSTTHGLKQLEYAQWKADLLKPISRTVKTRLIYNTRTDKYYSTCSFYTRATEELLNIHGLFYGPTKQIQPAALAHITSPLSWAVWYMDDGTLNRRTGRIDFCTDSFTYAGQLLLQAKLLEWNIRAQINPYGAHYRLHLSVKEARKFIDLVKPYIIPSMCYKLTRG